MGTETATHALCIRSRNNIIVKLNNPLMGTETDYPIKSTIFQVNPFR